MKKRTSRQDISNNKRTSFIKRPDFSKEAKELIEKHISSKLKYNFGYKY